MFFLLNLVAIAYFYKKQQISGKMLTKGMHQIVQIEFQKCNFSASERAQATFRDPCLQANLITNFVKHAG